MIKQLCLSCNFEAQKIRYPIFNGRWQCKWQCPRCGWKSSDAIKKPANFNDLPLFDSDLFQVYSSIQSDLSKTSFTGVDYYAYIESDKWKQRRKPVIEKYPFCQVCKLAPSTQVHHISYKNLGDEKDWELLAVCKDCHKEIHGLNKQWIEPDYKTV